GTPREPAAGRHAAAGRRHGRYRHGIRGRHHRVRGGPRPGGAAGLTPLGGLIMTDLFRHRMSAAVKAARPLARGKVTGAVGLRVTVSGLEARVGDLLRMGDGPDAVLAEVAALDGEKLSCLPLGPLAGIGAGTPVTSTGGPLRVPVGPDLRGRILDGLGRPMDGGPPLRGEPVSIEASPPSAMERQLVDAPMPLGVRVLDTLVPCGRGQRMGIFAGSGVGKSSLLSMITRGTS